MKLLIFDFDGTIADTKSTYYNSMKSELGVFGFTASQIDKAIDVGMSLKKTLDNLGFNFLVNWWIRRRIRRNVLYGLGKVQKCKDADWIKKIKFEKILVTNSLKEFAVPILQHLKLKREFSEIYGADDFSDKAEFISGYLKKRKIDRKECFYIGDRVADVLVSRKVGCKSVVISGKCAWDSRAELVKAKPDYLIDDLADLQEIID